MDAGEAKRWVDAGWALPDGCADLAVINAALGALTRLTGAIDAQRVSCVQALRRVTAMPQVEVAVGGRVDSREAERIVERAATVERAQPFGEALASGQVSAGHVDQLGASLRRLTSREQAGLLDQVDELVDVAQQATAQDFASFLKRREQALRADGGEARFEQQKRDVRLRTWTDDAGMSNWRLTVDPQTALGLTSRLRAATEAMFHAGTMPAHAPKHPMERESFLRAHALIGLINGTTGGSCGRPEWLVVEDRRVPPGQHPVLDTGTDTELPASAWAALRLQAVQHTVITDGDRIFEAKGRADHGRDRRLATADQRRMLRALYSHCAIPGCAVRFDECTIHHVIWWRPPLLGPTDLDNLIPVCWRHHSAIHDHSWTATLGPDRHLTVTTDTGEVLHGWPNRREHTASASANAVQQTPAGPAPPHPPPVAPWPLGGAPPGAASLRPGSPGPFQFGTSTSRPAPPGPTQYGPAPPTSAPLDAAPSSLAPAMPTPTCRTHPPRPG